MVFFLVYGFLYLGKRYHLTRWMLSSYSSHWELETAYICGLVIYTQQQYWLLSVSWGGHLVFFVPWLRINLVAGEGAKGDDTKRAFLLDHIGGGGVFFSRQVISGMIWCILPFILGMFLLGREGITRPLHLIYSALRLLISWFTAPLYL